MQRTGRRPGVKSLVEGDRAAGHLIAVHIEQTEDDLGGSVVKTKGLDGSGNGCQRGELRTRADGCIDYALAGSVEAGINGAELALGQGTDGEDFGGDAGFVGERGGSGLGGDARSGGLPRHCLCSNRQAVVEHQGQAN